MLEYLFGNKEVEKILFYLLQNDKCYGAQLSGRFDASLYNVQKALQKLEAGGVIVSFKEGKTRMFYWNPRFAFLEELKSFMSKAYTFLPQNHRRRFYEPPIRKRPRRSGKPL